MVPCRNFYGAGSDGLEQLKIFLAPCYPVQIMPSCCLLPLFLFAAMQAAGQIAPPATAPLPKDPHELLAMAAPYYDFNDPILKPWHLKATYQLYDEEGKPSEQGTFEYWWASPTVFRTTWTRPSATRTEWHTADGALVYVSSGEALRYFEKQLHSSLFTPLPSASILSPQHFRLDLQERKIGIGKCPCISVTMLQQNSPINRASEPISTYCFDSNLPVLRAASTISIITTVFDNIAKVQGRFLPNSIHSFVSQKEIFSAKVESVSGIAATDAALTPAPGAQLLRTDEVVHIEAGEVINGRLIAKQVPVYPLQAKAARQQGVVLLNATIGIDGKVHDLNVIYAPSSSLAASAKDAVSQWQYKPYMVNGKPVEVETTVNVIFTLGG